jgi:hypothetical protein
MASGRADALMAWLGAFTELQGVVSMDRGAEAVLSRLADKRVLVDVLDAILQGSLRASAETSIEQVCDDLPGQHGVIPL